MRLVHMADLHIGFRQYQRTTSAGINQREHDVARAFHKAIDKTIALRPEVVLFAGDIFHTVRPANPAIIQTFTELARLTQALPDAAVVMVAGNHDSPRTVDVGCLLKLFAPLGISVVADGRPELLRFPSHDLTVLAVPDTAAGIKGAPIPRPPTDTRYNVLLLHGEIAGILPAAAEHENQFTPEQIGAHNWDYVALGHFHVWRSVAPNAFYTGSLEYTSTNIWGETAEAEQLRGPGKGFVEWDLESGRQTFHATETRAIVDLPIIDADGLTTAEVDEAIRARVEESPTGIDDAVVRLRVRDAGHHVSRELDHKALREYKRRALHFSLDMHRADASRARSYEKADRLDRRTALSDLLRSALTERPMDADVDRAELVATGLDYLQQAEELELQRQPAGIMEER